MKTSQQSLTVRVRETFRKQLRKKELQRQFAEHRKAWKEQAHRSEQKEFNSIYLNINEETYRQYIPFLLRFSNNPEYNYMLIPYAGFAYDDFLSEPTSESSLRILEALSQYEEIELPQSEEFVEALLAVFPQRARLVLTLISNLIDYPRYSEVLRDLLLEGGFLKSGQEMVCNLLEHDHDLKKEDSQIVVSLFFSCCCEFLKSHPAVHTQFFKEITAVLVNLLTGQEEQFMLLDMLASIGSSFNPNIQMADHLFGLFHHVVQKEYHNFEHEATQFLIYCIRSNIILPIAFQKLIFSSLEGHSSIIVLKVLAIFQLQIKIFQEVDRKNIYQEFKELELMQRLRNLFNVWKEDVQMEVMECLFLLTRPIVTDQADPEQTSHLVAILTKALDHSHSTIVIQALKIILKGLQAIHDEELELACNFSALLQREGLEARLNAISDPSQELGPIIEGILHFLPQQ